MWRTTTHLVVVLLSSFCRFNLNTIHHSFYIISNKLPPADNFLTNSSPVSHLCSHPSVNSTPTRFSSHPFFIILHFCVHLSPPSFPPPEHPSGHRPGGPIAIRGRGQIGGARETLPLGGCPHHFWKALGEFHLSKSREKI